MTEYAYNNNKHSVIKMSSFEIMFDETSNWQDKIQELNNDDEEVLTTLHRVQKIIEIKILLQIQLESIKKTQAKYYNRIHISKTYNIDDKIRLNFKNIKSIRFFKKLNWKYYASLIVISSVKKQAYKLKMSESYVKMHDVFHVSLLELYLDWFEKNEISLSLDVKSEIHLEMKKILNSRQFKTKLQYRVKWKEYSKLDNQWINVENMRADELISEFHIKYSNKSNKSREREKSSHKKRRR